MGAVYGWVKFFVEWNIARTLVQNPYCITFAIYLEYGENYPKKYLFNKLEIYFG